MRTRCRAVDAIHVQNATWVWWCSASISMPHRAFGERAIDVLVDPDERPEVHRMPMRLHARGRVAPPR
jgi:LacI family transcriptional regulator